MESLLARSAFNIFKLLYCVATGVDFTQYTLWKGQVFFLVFFFIFHSLMNIYKTDFAIPISRFRLSHLMLYFSEGRKERKKKKQTLCYFHKLNWNPKTGRHIFFIQIWNLSDSLSSYTYIVNLLWPTLLRLLLGSYKFLISCKLYAFFQQFVVSIKNDLMFV